MNDHPMNPPPVTLARVLALFAAPPAIGSTTPNDGSFDALTVTGTARFTGAVDQSVQGINRLDIGVQADTPRIVLENTSAPDESKVWLIDNASGTFRIYIPGFNQLQLVTNSGHTPYLRLGASELIKLDTAGVSTFSGGGLRVAATGGNGYFEVVNQSGAPSTPTSAGRLFFDSSNRLSWIGTNGFTRKLDGTANTASRTYTLPDGDGTLLLTTLAGQTLNNTTIGGTTPQPGTFTLVTGVVSDSATATTVNAGVLEHRTSGTPATNFGVGLLFLLQSTTLVGQSAARVRAVWSNAATPIGNLTLSVWNAGSEVNAMTVTPTHVFFDSAILLRNAAEIRSAASGGQVRRLARWNASDGVDIGSATGSADSVTVNLFAAGVEHARVDTSGVSVPSADAYYLGAPATDGTWRVIRSGNDLKFQRRESGSYVDKSTIAA